MKNLNYEAVILSVDGVLYDLNTFKQQIYAEIMTQHDLEVHPYFFELLLDGGYQQIERAYIHYNQYRPIRDELEQTFNKRLLNALDNQEIKPFAPSLKFLQWLDSLQIEIGFVSSYKKEIVTRLIETYPINLNNNILVCGNEVFEGKPEKDIFAKAAKKMKINPYNTLAIEASVNGVMAAYLANMQSVYVEVSKLRVEKAQKFSQYQFPNLEKVKSII